VSALTTQRLATLTVETCDELLLEWQASFGRGDVDPRTVTPIVDALLDLANAARPFIADPVAA
jgi:hypothetical protein